MIVMVLVVVVVEGQGRVRQKWDLNGKKWRTRCKFLFYIVIRQTISDDIQQHDSWENDVNQFGVHWRTFIIIRLYHLLLFSLVIAQVHTRIYLYQALAVLLLWQLPLLFQLFDNSISNSEAPHSGGHSTICSSLKERLPDLYLRSPIIHRTTVITLNLDILPRIIQCLERIAHRIWPVNCAHTDTADHLF